MYVTEHYMFFLKLWEAVDIQNNFSVLFYTKVFPVKLCIYTLRVSP